MATYQIPKDHLQGFHLLQKLSAPKFLRLLNGLRKSGKGLYPEELANIIGSKIGTSKKESVLITQLLFSAYGLKFKYVQSTEKLVEDLYQSIKNDELFKKLKEPEWKTFKDKLSELFSLDSSIGITVKTQSLSGEYEKIFSSCRIITDVRPAFYDINKKLDSALIMHSLKLELQTAKGSDEVFLSLDSLSLKELKEQISRAEKKESAIRKTLGDKLFFLSPRKNSNT